MTRIVFMGTPEFAVPILEGLAQNYEVAAVYTRADKPAGRGNQVAESPIKTLARAKGFVVEQPRTLRESQAQARLAEFKPDLIVVAAYGLILPQVVLDIPRLGCINTHASLLPRWRGSSPITAAILAGDAETGVTLMRMEAGVDTGPILATRKIKIDPDDTSATLGHRLARVAADLVIEKLPAWLENRIEPIPQAGAPSVAGLVKKGDGLIHWERPAEEIERAVRAYNPWPSAYTFWSQAQQGGRGISKVVVKLTRAEILKDQATSRFGTVVAIGDKIGVCTGSGILVLRELQLAGKRSMSVEEFVRGQRGFIGSVLGSD